MNNFVIKQRMVWAICLLYTLKKFSPSIVITLSTVANFFYTAFFLCCGHNIFFENHYDNRYELSVDQ